MLLFCSSKDAFLEGQVQDTEFWNRDDEGSFSGEDISDSDGKRSIYFFFFICIYKQETSVKFINALYRYFDTKVMMLLYLLFFYCIYKQETSIKFIGALYSFLATYNPMHVGMLVNRNSG